MDDLLDSLKDLCQEECYKDLDECSFIREVKGPVPPHLISRALKDLVSSAKEGGCDPSKALSALINLLRKE